MMALNSSKGKAAIWLVADARCIRPERHWDLSAADLEVFKGRVIAGEQDARLVAGRTNPGAIDMDAAPGATDSNLAVVDAHGLTIDAGGHFDNAAIADGSNRLR